MRQSALLKRLDRDATRPEPAQSSSRKRCMLLSSNQADDQKPDEPDPRHAPRNVGLQDLTPILTLLEQEERVYMGSMVYSVKELSEARDKIQLPCP